MTHVHFVGIGGSGLSAIALLLLESGYTVSGSDRQLSPLARRLQEAGVQVFAGHHPVNVHGADVVVRSSAVPDENVEVQAARAAGVPVLKRADFLRSYAGQIIAGRQCIAVAGAHGKTTTTAMIAWMLSALGQDPSFIIGGVAANLGSNAHAGRGPYFVIEADEYDRMFLGLQPQIAVVTNLEHDHPDCFPTPQDFYQAFLDFVDRLAPQGALLACGDDPGAGRLLAAAAARGHHSLSYGIEAKGYDYQAYHLSTNTAGGFTFEAACHSPFAREYSGRDLSPIPYPLPPVSLQVPGEHNVRNALAALAVADLLGLPLDGAARALGEFTGAGRRFEVRGEAAGVIFIDDYAHHPTEIRATLAAARVRYPGRRIWAIWQPHTYSRTRTLFEDFISSFQDADRVLVMEIFAAREPAPADGFSARRLAEVMPYSSVHFVPGLDEARELLLGSLRSGDVALVLSAGDADQLITRLLEDLQGGRRQEGRRRENGDLQV